MKLDNGYTMMHEHITIDLSGEKRDEDCCLDCREETIQELKQLYRLGVRNIVDATNEGMGQNVSYVKEVERETGIRILQSVGYYKMPFLPEQVYVQTAEELAEGMIRKITEGFQGSGVKASVIGEIGTSKNEMKEIERKVLDAGILAYKSTGVPIYTHTTLGTCAIEQTEYFLERGVRPQKVVIGHMDLSGSLDYIKEVLRLGVFVGFDTIGKNNYFPDEKRVEFLMELEKERLLSQVVLSMDLTRKSGLKFKGGPGYSYLFTNFLPMLRTAGMQESSISQMLIDNPMTFFA